MDRLGPLDLFKEVGGMGEGRATKYTKLLSVVVFDTQ